MNVVPLNQYLREYPHIGAALKADLEAAPSCEFGRLTAVGLASQLEKSPEWVWAVMRGDIVPSLRDVLAWEDATGGACALKWLCAKRGLLAIPWPAGDGAMCDVAEVLSSVSRYAGQLAEVYRDGEVDREEARNREQVEALCKEAVSACIGLLTRYSVDAGTAITGREKSLLKTAGRHS